MLKSQKVNEVHTTGVYWILIKTKLHFKIEVRREEYGSESEDKKIII